MANGKRLALLSLAADVWGREATQDLCDDQLPLVRGKWARRLAQAGRHPLVEDPGRTKVDTNDDEPSAGRILPPLLTCDRARCRVSALPRNVEVGATRRMSVTIRGQPSAGPAVGQRRY